MVTVFVTAEPGERWCVLYQDHQGEMNYYGLVEDRKQAQGLVNEIANVLGVERVLEV